MLPPPALAATDRLIDAFVTLAQAVGAVALTRSTATLPIHVAQALLLRLAALVTTLVRVAALGVPARTRRSLRVPVPPYPRVPAHPITVTRLPRRPGWLLDALPDDAPAVAAGLAPLLDDPAFAALRAAAPTLNHPLATLLRALGLTPPNPAPTPTPPTTKPDTKPKAPSAAPPSNPAPSAGTPPAPDPAPRPRPVESRPRRRGSSHDLTVTYS